MFEAHVLEAASFLVVVSLDCPAESLSGAFARRSLLALTCVCACLLLFRVRCGSVD